jgi:GNAT superfamily N-acetyltransferase
MKHRFYKELEDRGALVYSDVIFAGGCLLSHHINEDDNFVLDIITTPVNARKQGYGTQVMNTLIDVSNTTNTPIELIVGTVRRNGWFSLRGTNIVGEHATKMKNKLPINKLKGWYSKFGFEVCGKKDNRTKMIYRPNTVVIISSDELTDTV